jgi:hypothetical protein
MGDNQAVELGQLAHIQLGFLARAFPPLELLVVHGRAPRSAVAAGIVIDDVVFSEKSMPKVETGELESVKLLNLLCEEYLQQGLLAHPKKTFRGEAVGEFWGCYADGVSGRVRANPKRLVPLIELSLRTARLGLASVALLETLAGGWIAILQSRRGMLCLVQFLYEAQRGRDQQDVVKLSNEAVQELFLLAMIYIYIIYIYIHVFKCTYRFRGNGIHGIHEIYDQGMCWSWFVAIATIKEFMLCLCWYDGSQSAV